MRRNARFLRSVRAVPANRLQDVEGTRNMRSRISPRNEISEQKILSVDRRKPNLEDSREKVASSTLITHDRELARILHELDQISEALKSEPHDAESLRNTLQRTVQCAVKQALLDRELCSLALTDDLTSLYNRRAFLALAG